MGIAAEFARFNAKLANVQWAVSARTAEGVVMSLWQHKLRTEDGAWVYRDRLSRWQGPGNRLFAEHLREALAQGLPLRVVKAIAADPGLVDRGEDASATRKTFHAVSDRVGRVLSFDGDAFELRFDRVCEADWQAVEKQRASPAREGRGDEASERLICREAVRTCAGPPTRKTPRKGVFRQAVRAPERTEVTVPMLGRWCADGLALAARLTRPTPSLGGVQ